MQYNRFLPLVIPIIIAFFSEIFFFWPQTIYIILVLGVLLFLFIIRQFTNVSGARKGRSQFIILPSIFFISLVTFSTLIPSKIFVQFLFLINIIFQYLYFRSVYYYFIKTDFYHNYPLENISAYGNFLTFYFTASSVYGLQSFLDAPIWLLMIIFLFVIFLIFYQIISINNIDLRQGIFYILLACLVLIELAWSASFLPLSYYILGLALAIFYYMLIGLLRFYLLNKLDRKIIKMYLFFGSASILIVLFTARWL